MPPDNEDNQWSSHRLNVNRRLDEHGNEIAELYRLAREQGEAISAVKASAVVWGMIAAAMVGGAIELVIALLRH